MMNCFRLVSCALVAAVFGAVGGILSLLLTGTPFSISAAVGFTSATGVGPWALPCFYRESGVRARKQACPGKPSTAGALVEMHPVMLACMAAGLGLLPAAISHGIGAQAQQPLARVVVGAMLTTTPAILLLVPIFASFAGEPNPPETMSES
jgi:cobalt-zinc-cadmium resistance protein CzcA